MNLCFSNLRHAYTIVELMVTVVIVAILVATLGTLVVMLLTLQENDREEAYVREKLVEVCGVYADALSVGSFVCTNGNQSFSVKYRTETGGISMETGRVSRVAYLVSSTNAANGTLDLKVYGVESTAAKLSSRMSGNAMLIPQSGDIVSCTITPLGGVTMDDAEASTPLGYLKVTARYKPKVGDGNVKMVSAKRMVRLWNRK